MSGLSLACGGAAVAGCEASHLGRLLLLTIW